MSTSEQTANMNKKHSCALIIEGAKGSGKTTYLIKQTLKLLASGVDGQNVILVAATPNAAHALRMRLEDATNTTDGYQHTDALKRLRVTTARDIALQALGTPEAQRFLGRVPRLLLPFEKRVLMEDLKVSGMKPRRMKEILRFFEHAMSDSKDGQSNYIEFEEERVLHNQLIRLLQFEGGMLPAEVSGCAVRFLLSNPAFLKRTHITHVLADDFQLMSRASQSLLGLLASECLTVAADAKATHPVFEEYPYPFFESDLIAAFAEVKRQKLAAPNGPDAVRVSAKTPHDEFADIATRTRAFIDEKPVARIYIATPNNTWSRGISSALEAAGVTHGATTNASEVDCDITDARKSALARVISLLALTDDPSDGVAWRTLCGLGVHLANNAGVHALMSLAEARWLYTESDDTKLDENHPEEHSACAKHLVNSANRPANFVSILAALAQNAPEGTDASAQTAQAPALKTALEPLTALEKRCIASMISTYQEALDLVKQARARSENERVSFICASVAKGDEALQHRLETEASKHRLFQERRLHTPPESQVVIGPYAGATGLSFDAVFATGAVDGFIVRRACFDASSTTPEQLERQTALWQAALYQTIGCASKPRIVTSFETLPLEQAERLGVRIQRIAAKGNQRIAKTYPSNLPDKL